MYVCTYVYLFPCRSVCMYVRTKEGACAMYVCIYSLVRTLNPKTLNQGPMCQTLVKLAKVSEAVEPEGKFQRQFQKFGA